MPATASTSSRANRALRWVATSALLAVGAFCALLLAIRLVGFPQLEARRNDIAQWLGARIGQPVEIDNVVTGWDGWNPKLSIRGFRVRDRANPAGVLLELPRVDLLVAWTSLPLLDLRFKELTIESPRLAVRRDPAGRLHVAGIEIESEQAVDDSAFADWLMRQPHVIVRDALVTWNDEYGRAPQLLLDQVQFRLEQRFGHHHVGLTGVPPAELAAPLDLRADLVGRSLKDWANLKGRLYLRMDYADVAAWREWLPLPAAVDSGKGALRVWIDFAQSQPTEVIADLELQDVHATLDDGLPALTLAHLSGRVAWKRDGPRTEMTARQLAYALPDGTALPATDFMLVLVSGSDGTAGGGNLSFKELELRPLGALAPHLPLPAALRRDIARFDPRGTLRNGALEWIGKVEAPDRYAAKLEFANFAVASQAGMPGGTNLSGTLDANERGGAVRIASKSATLALPKVFADALAFDTLGGDVAWQRNGDALQLQLKDVHFGNDDLAGSSAGTWRSHAGNPGTIDLKLQLTRANLTSAHRYIPLVAGTAARDWLRRSLTKGTSNDAKLTLTGDLSQFPFATGKNGQFVIAVKAQDATLQYAEKWPAITDIAGEFHLEGVRIVVSATAGRALGAQVGATRAEIADVRDPRAALVVDGVASGPTTAFLTFVAQSPVADWSGHVADEAAATGDGRLALKFNLPLHDVPATTVAGQFQFASNAIRFTGAPQLSAVNGTLHFTERQLTATDVAAEAFGGPLKLQVATEGGRVHITGTGSADLALVRKQYEVPLGEHVTGTTDWQLTLDSRDRQLAWIIESSLQGATIDLPAPLRKAAAEKVALRIERREPRPRDDRIAISYGASTRVLLRRQPEAQGAGVDRALILLGKAVSDTAEPLDAGVWIRGDVATLVFDEWLALDPKLASASTSGGEAETLALNGVDLTVTTLQMLGRTFTRLKTSARRQGSDWRLTLDGADLAGTATWRGTTASQPNGRFVARFARFATPPAMESTSNGNAVSSSPTAGANRWPEVDLVADSLQSKGRALGKLEFIAQPAGTDWQIQKLALANDAGRIDANGSWRNAAGRSQTRLDVTIDVKESGAFLDRFGWGGAVIGAPTKIEGQLSWTGAPSDFDYPSLGGKFTLRAGAGQFTKLDPGVGRLLGVLSLQALPRRISLDFRDVFSEGFAFDTVSADVRVQNGVMHTDDFRLAGPAAAVIIAGDVDLARETQQLRVRVAPSLSSGVSAGAAALFIANPLLGAAVGAGTLLAQKMLNNPFDQLFSYQYLVTGSWDDPQVARSAMSAASARSQATVRGPGTTEER